VTQARRRARVESGRARDGEARERRYRDDDDVDAGRVENR